MSGLFGGQVGVALLESREEDGVFFTEAGVFGLESGVFLAPRLGPVPCGGILLVPPVQRLIAELLGLLFPVKALRMESIAGGVIVS